MTTSPKNPAGSGGKPYKIAHYSDFHIKTAADCRVAVKMIKHAIESDVDHLVITGDLMGAADMTLAKRFWNALTRLGWANAQRSSFAPGNHDVYAVSDAFGEDQLRAIWESRRYLQNPRGVRDRVAQITRSSRQEEDVSKLCSPDVFAVGKILAGGKVVVATVDTTHAPTPNLREMFSAGQLRTPVRKAIQRYFTKHATAAHRILAMHHSPFDEEIEYSKLSEQRFVDPKPAEVLQWIGESGATLVCCGHIHEASSIRKQHQRDCLILRAGTAGGRYDHQRRYHVLSLYPNGKVTVRRVAYREA